MAKPLLKDVPINPRLSEDDVLRRLMAMPPDPRKAKPKKRAEKPAK